MAENKLSFEIHRFSSYSSSYLPENILEDCPKNQSSRWSSASNTPPQFLLLKLRRPAIVKRIKFGKYEKTHVCNLKKFKILGGMDENHLTVLFEGGLRNDSTPEIFKLRYLTDSGNFLPVLFIQIMPLLSWGPSFNFSIWFVELLGQDDPIFVRTSLRNYNKQREIAIVKLCLKHFREHGYESAFQALQDQTNVLLEHPILSQLYEILVNRGDFADTERFVEHCVNDGYMDGYLSSKSYKASWQEVDSGHTPRPGMRGGHQLVIDNSRGKIWLYGGWDGIEDLSDLWCFDIHTSLWRLIHERSEKLDGPMPRSCHKMVFDPTSNQIFILGRYLDRVSRTKEQIKSEFYLFDTFRETWLLICDDTSQVGGPQLLFDHQMCLDVDQQMIYVFGGRIVTPRNIDDLQSNDPQYSGLFSYHIGTNTWQQILVDCGHPSASNPDVNSIKSRVTHSMLFHNKHRNLYIFGGQRNKSEYTTDFLSFNVDTHQLKVFNANSAMGAAHQSHDQTVPQSGFTQRATIDCDRDEIYVLSSLSKEKERRDLNINSFWTYSLKNHSWTCISECDHSTEKSNSKNQQNIVCSEPCPRYAHQLVYDSVNKAHYLFGGNPGRNIQLRLDDFWVLKLEKPSRMEILKHCKYLVRRLEYEEIAKSEPLRAVNYLQTKLHDIIDHNDEIALREFHKLASLLFIKPEEETQMESESGLIAVSLLLEDEYKQQERGDHQCPKSLSKSSSLMRTNISNRDGHDDERDLLVSEESVLKSQRCLLFNKLVKIFPENMVQPKWNLTDFVLT